MESKSISCVPRREPGAPPLTPKTKINFPSQIWPTQRGNETNHQSNRISTQSSLSINVADEATQQY